MTQEPAPRPAPSTPPTGPAEITVEVTVDFGPLPRPRLHGRVVVPAGSSVIAATRALAGLERAVEQDWLCCSAEDVWSIAGVGPEPRLDRAWSWRLGDRSGPELPARHRVAEGDAITWVYAAGAVPAPTARVVSLLPAATEITIAVGGEAALVGISHVCTPPPGRTLPRVLSTRVDSDAWSMGRIDRCVRDAGATKEPLYQLDDAAIEALRPTLVVSQGLCPVCAASPELARTAAGDRARLLVLSPHSLADVAGDIRTLATALGREPAGRIAARAFERRFAALRALPRLEPRPRVVVLEWFDPLWASGEWIAEMVEAAGGEPVLVTARDSSRRVTWPELAAANPDVLVLAACSMSIERTWRELGALRDAAAWAELRAVAAGRVFVLDGARHTSTPGPGLAEGAEVLREVLTAPADAPDTARWRRVPAR